MSHNESLSRPAEPLLTIGQAAEALGLPRWKVARAVKNGLLPSYTLLNSRKLVRASELVAVIESTREGGGA